MNQRLKKTTWRIPHTMTKEKVCLDNKLLSWTNMNKRWTSKTNFFFTWFTEEVDYKVKCTALTVLKISSIKILAVEVLILSVVASDLKTKNINPIEIYYIFIPSFTNTNYKFNNSPRFPSSSFLDRWKIAGWGGWGTLQSFIQGGSTLWSNLVPIYKRLLIKTVPLSNTFHWKRVPLSHT